MILILGGARSGKSTYAECKAHELSQETGEHVLYIATALAFDEDMKDRIKKHQAARPPHWHTIERFKNFDALVEEQAFQESQVILLDCMTLMVSNLLLQYDVDFDQVSRQNIDEIEAHILSEVEILLSLCQKYNKKLIIVSNEVGLGIVPAYRLGNIFRDIAGRINQRLAKEAKQVFFLVSGLPLQIK